MVSKELLAEILDLELVENVQINWQNINEIVYTTKPAGETISEMVEEVYSNSRWRCVNIYELAHKCKEWAFNKGYTLVVFKTLGYTTYAVEIHDESDYIELIDSFTTEPDAIFKACEWILKRIKDENSTI